MMKRYRISPIALGEFSATPEVEVPARIQIFRAGTFHHPEYGRFDLNKEVFLAMKKNFDEKTRGVDLAIDYNHDSEAHAAGWIQTLFLNDDGSELWAEVKWTPNGKNVLMNREFRYMSGDFTFNYVNNETLQEYGPTLLGAGLTNRPVIKDMAPVIELTESKKKGIHKMEEIETLKVENKKLSEQVTKLTEAAASVAAAAPYVAPEADDYSKMQPADLIKKIEELEAKLKAMQGEKEVMAKEKYMSEKTSKFEKLLSEGKVVAAQKESFMTGDAEKFAELAQPLNLVNKGTGGLPPVNMVDTETQILELAHQSMKDKKVSTVSEGIRRALSENPELRKSYEAKKLTK